MTLKTTGCLRNDNYIAYLIIMSAAKLAYLLYTRRDLRIKARLSLIKREILLNNKFLENENKTAISNKRHKCRKRKKSKYEEIIISQCTVNLKSDKFETPTNLK